VFRGQWDAIPFISVFFLLLLFLALQSRLAFVPGVPITLPAGGGPPAHAGATLLAAVDHSGQVYYENQAVTEQELGARLRADTTRIGSPVTLVLHADKSVSIERLARLQDLATAAGVREILLATGRPAPGRDRFP
jgi:biopolymer transport protein ExbD